MRRPPASQKKSSTVPTVELLTVPLTDLKKQKRTLALICAAIAFLLYANTFNHDYTVDDGTVIENNKITTKGISAIPEIFTTPYRKGFWDRKESLYRPLSLVMFAIEWQIAPHKPWLGHLINVLLYAVTGFLLFYLLSALFSTKPPWLAFFTTLLFIVHPVHTEVIANIKSRDEILCFLFSIAAFYSLLLFARQSKTKHLAISAACYFLALLSKESAITLVALFPLLFWFFGDKTWNEISKWSLVYVGIVAVFMLLRYSVLKTVSGNYEVQLVNNSLLGATDGIQRFATATYILGKYLLLLIAPVYLVFDYSYNTVPLVSLGSIQALLSLLVYLGFGWFAIRNFNKKNPVAFGILFFLATMSLVSNIFFLIEATMAERFLYMPSLGFCVAIGALFYALFNPKPTPKNYSFQKTISSQPLALTFLIVCALFSMRTFARNMDWKNNITLLAKDVKTSPNSARIRYAYGSAILIEEALKENDENKKQNLLQASINELEKGVALIPEYADAWYHLGIAYKEFKDAPNAIRCFEKARSYRPFKDAEAYIASGLAYGSAGRYEEAIADLIKATELDPKSSEAFNNLGLHLCDAGKINESLAALNNAIVLNPNFSKAYYNMGNTYAKAGDYRTALEKYRKAISIEPQYGDAYNNIGNCFGAMKVSDSAKIYYEQAVQIDPSNVKAVINLGITWQIIGDTAKANQCFNQARSMGAQI